MSYTTAEGRQQVLDTVAQATEQLGMALSSLTEAYELLDENMAGRLERELFRPVQGAYGRAQRTHAEFAERHGLPGRTFDAPPAGAPGRGVRAFLDSAVQAVTAADMTLGTLQDSMLPVEVGDAQLRAGLSEIRAALADVGSGARELERTLGR